MKSAHTELTPGLTRLLAMSAGLTVANIYYNQSLLPAMAREFHVTAGATGTVAVATQLGYASGLLLLVPLGDTLDRKRLLIASAFGSGLMLLVIAFSFNLSLAIAGSYLAGLIGITPILAVAYGASLARPEQRGRVVGAIMGGLLVGVLFSRTAAGFLGEWFGWRAVFMIGAGLTWANALALTRLPATPRPPQRLSYAGLLRSLPALFLREPALRRHALIGALGFGAFSVFWTTLAFYLADRPEHYGGRAVGLFGLVAVAGALAAPISGRLSDRLSARVVNGSSLALMVVAFLMMALADISLLWLVLAVFLMDAGAQASHISNQTRIMGLSAELRNRITSIYMVLFFVGGALGSALGSQMWTHWRWPGVWLTGAIISAGALAVLFNGDRAPGFDGAKRVRV